MDKSTNYRPVETRQRVDLLTGPCCNQRQPLLTHSNFLDFHDSSTRLLNPNWQGASFWNIDAMLNVGIINCITENQKLFFNFRWSDKGPSVVINSFNKTYNFSFSSTQGNPLFKSEIYNNVNVTSLWHQHLFLNEMTANPPTQMRFFPFHENCSWRCTAPTIVVVRSTKTYLDKAAHYKFTSADSSNTCSQAKG